MTSGYRKGSRSKTHRGKNFTKKNFSIMKSLNSVYKDIVKPFGSNKGTSSQSRKGRLNYITHKGSKNYNRNGHYQKGRPYRGGGAMCSFTRNDRNWLKETYGYSDRDLDDIEKQGTCVKYLNMFASNW